jgi:hypothetical protein
MSTLTAEIKLVEPEGRACFALAPTPITPDVEEAWYAGILKSCGSGIGGCQIGPAAKLIEMACFDGMKRAVLDPNLPPGYWLGIEVIDDHVWKAITAGAVTSFEVDLSPSGLTIQFPGIQKNVQKTIQKKENSMFIETTSCSCSNLPENLPATVQKALKGDPVKLSKADFDTALDDLAKAERRDGESFADAYARILNTGVGEKLYDGYTMAAAAEPVIEKQDGPNVSQAWGKITTAALKLQSQNPALEHSAAIDRVLKENPSLYTEYCDESAAGTNPAASNRV